MGELEQQVIELELENQKLHIENRLLREKTSGLLTENEELRQRLGLDTLDSKEKVHGLLSTGNEADGSDSTDSESDLLLGILDILDPELFLKSCEQECQEPQVQLVGGGNPVPATTPATLGSSSVKLEALNELIHFDHIYTKPVEEVSSGQCSDSESDTEEKIDEAIFPITEVVVEEETGLDKEACLADTYSDSGYEGSPSPFSDMSSSLCSESSWEDMFASELFPQLISV
ncbi:hypothetical protein D5F01_LYC09388 [Larimichthys crocea]|uniref:X-box-binding protein 1 n=1 Tax=Larimichthys crocea TaxID=215358 RepID=A0A6G0IKI8_LARCR|nr:hypothetical protein D5F01_LYC09388 [Larimichthys crocea]